LPNIKVKKKIKQNAVLEPHKVVREVVKKWMLIYHFP